MIWLTGIIDSMGMSLSKLQEMVKSGKPGVLQSMGSQTVGYDRATEQQTRRDPRHMAEENTKLIHKMGHYKLIRKG